MPLTNAGREALEALTPRTRPVTEEEANGFYCPFAFPLNEPFGCRGSTCMLWRWKNLGVSGEQLPPTGFCGAGGEPS